ncbi:glycosyltransferase [Acidocella sp.]|uniref:glycosyltransferase n=1 Tax=Acidocella sp. TaxID=50710 RepID=UPI002619C5B5|nr:glycosyltransferase [Acidocella sp.]
MNASQSNHKGDPAVDIVLPCYNAAAWIDEFVNGLLALKGVSWHLIARDDGSSDGTLALLRAWHERLGPRMTLLDAEHSNNLGLIGNYSAVLEASTAPWVLTADPDDVWLPNRVPLTLAALQTAEAETSAQTPVAVCTDAEVVNSQLGLVAPSYWRWSRTKPLSRPRLARVAMDSVALGSTMAVNRALLRKALPLPQSAAYQDWWLALVAVAFGRFIALPDITIRYRRHGENATKDPYSLSLASAAQRLLRAPYSLHARLAYLLSQIARQTDAFVERHGQELPFQDAVALSALAGIQNLNAWPRRWTLLRHGCFFNSALKTLGLLLFC